MLAVKHECATTTRIILEFGVDPAVILRRDANGSTPLHIAAQNTSKDIVELLLQYGPTEQLYIENSVGQTPLDIASLKNLPRVTDPVKAGPVPDFHTNIDYQLRRMKNAAPFDVEKQKVEIQKLRATLDTLLADGHLVRDTKLATELLAFADHLEGKLAIEVEKKSAAGKDTEGGYGNEVNPKAPQGTTATSASTYALLRDAVAAHPGHRQLAHLADVQHSVKRCLALEAENALLASSRRGDEESKEVDPEEQRIAELKSRSIFGSASTNPCVNYKNSDCLFGEDRF